jgi:hypothetical protein
VNFPIVFHDTKQGATRLSHHIFLTLQTKKKKYNNKPREEIYQSELLWWLCAVAMQWGGAGAHVCSGSRTWRCSG